MMIGDFTGAADALVMTEEAGEVPDYWKTGIACIIRIAELDHNEQYREVLAVQEESPECSKGHS